MIKRSAKNTFIAERERFLDMQEQIKYETSKSLKDMHYEELLEVLNKDLPALEQMSGQKNTSLKVFEEEKALEARIEKEREEVV